MGSSARSARRVATKSHTIVAYREEGGIGGPKGSLTVSARGLATVTIAGGRAPVAHHVVRFHLAASTRGRLRSALKRADIHALAGDHLPPTPYPDEITYAITVGHDRVRTTAGWIPTQLEPLLSILREVVQDGAQRNRSAA
jgi:hypothetical protein